MMGPSADCSHSRVSKRGERVVCRSRAVFGGLCGPHWGRAVEEAEARFAELPAAPATVLLPAIEVALDELTDAELLAAARFSAARAALEVAA